MSALLWTKFNPLHENGPSVEPDFTLDVDGWAGWPFEATSLSSWGDRDRFMGFQTYREGLQGGRGFRHTRGESKMFRWYLFTGRPPKRSPFDDGLRFACLDLLF